MGRTNWFQRWLLLVLLVWMTFPRVVASRSYSCTFSRSMSQSPYDTKGNRSRQKHKHEWTWQCAKCGRRFTDILHRMSTIYALYCRGIIPPPGWYDQAESRICQQVISQVQVHLPDPLTTRARAMICGKKKKKNQQPVIGSQWLDRPVALRLWRSRLWTGSGRSVDCPTYFWHEFLGISWVLQGCSEFCTCCRQLFFMNIHQKFQNHSIVKSKNKSCCRSTSRAWSCSSYRSSFRLRKWAQEIVHINSIFTWRIIRIWWWITVMSTSAIVSSQCPLRTKGRAQEQYSLLGRGAFVVARRVSIPWQWQFSVHHSRPLLWCNIFSGWLTVAVSWFRSSVVLTLSKQVQLSLFVWG